jgi:hypothetical protein
MSLPVLDETPVVYNRGFSFYTFSCSASSLNSYFCMSMQNTRPKSYFLFSGILFLFFSCALIAQQNNRVPKKDTTSIPIDSTKHYRFREDVFVAGGKIIELSPITTRLDGFQFTGYRHLALGNLGAPSLLFQFSGAQADAFRRQNSSYAFFGYSDQNRIFYTSKKPYTLIRYVVGQRRASDTEVLHAHNFGPNCNITFGFLRQRAEGFYNRQQTNNTSFRLNGWYWSAGNRYALTGDFYWTGVNAQENGGIKQLSSFENAVQLDRRLVAINLLDADSRQRVRSGRVKQYLAFGTVIDTLVIRGDSLDDRDTLKLKQIIRPRAALTHTMQFRDEAGWYFDQNPDSGFYANIYRDSVETADSSSLWRFSNAVAVELFPSWQETVYPISGAIGLRHEIGRLRNDTIRHDFQNIYAEGLVRLAKPNAMLLRSIEADGWYVLSGENTGDFRFRVNAADRTILVKSLVMQASAEVSQMQPVYLARHFSGNHFRWVNNFSQEGIARAGASVMLGSHKSYSWLQLAADFYSYSKPVYFDTTRLPAQFNGNINAIRIELSHTLNYKKLHWRGSAQWNKLPESSVIRLPEFIVRQSVYFEFRLFKRALLMQAGTDAEWFSGYFAQAYNPNIAQFYLQNSQEIGNYLYLDPWISIRIKPVRVFVKADHVNAGLFGRKYYLAPRYPHNDFALRLGISWVFND